MGKRKDNGKWTTPGGHVDAEDDDHHTAATRELFEEAGIKPELKHLGESEVTAENGEKHQITMYEANKTGGITTKHDPDDEVEKWEWIDTKNGLPEEVNSNLHSPKNVLLEHYGIEH